MKKVLLFCLLATVIFVTLPFGEAEASRKEKEIANVAHRELRAMHQKIQSQHLI